MFAGKVVVEIVTVLAAPTFGLLGVLAGGFRQAKGEETKFEHERQVRELESKRTAYMQFIEAYSRVTTASADDKERGRHAVMSDVLRLEVLLSIVGSVEVAQAAEDAKDDLNALVELWVEGTYDDTTEQAAKQFRDSDIAFKNAVRKDLGAAGALPPHKVDRTPAD